MMANLFRRGISVIVALLAIAIVGCQSNAFPVVPTSLPTSTAPIESSPTASPFNIDLSTPFAFSSQGGQPIVLQTWSPKPYAGSNIALPLNTDQISNPHVLDGLTNEQRAFLEKNGFVVIHSQEGQFGDIRVETSAKTGQPYYLTTDAAYHALHLNFDELLKELELQTLRPQMMVIIQATLDKTKWLAAQFPDASDQSEALRAEAYLSVALKLFNSQASIDPAISDEVSRQVDQIMSASGPAPSALFPDFLDDYGAYQPVGHYAGDPDLKSYFRAMTWLGRVHFLLRDPSNPDLAPTRVPLLITWALQHAQLSGQSAAEAGLSGQSAAQAWVNMYQILNFLIGPSDDAGPLEYSKLMQTFYGSDPSVQDLSNPEKWKALVAQADQLPAPQINSLFVQSTINLSPEKGWRFFGQRFTLDSLILQNMIYDRVQQATDGTRRNLPSGLDVMAALGSQPALQTLNDLGESKFPNYSEQMTNMHKNIQAQPETQWLARFYNSWLYSFIPLLTPKDASAYPAYMTSTAWKYKELNTALGSWAELKHDTALYTKLPLGAGGGGPPLSDSAPSYVEPNPQAFYRMAYMAHMLSSGLQDRLPKGSGFLPDRLAVFTVPTANSEISITNYLDEFNILGDQLKTFGDISTEELAGVEVSRDEMNTITSCLGWMECMDETEGYSKPRSQMPDPAVVASVASSNSNNEMLEVATGSVDRVFVVVPLEGKNEVAQGGVFSYYEFTQPSNSRLTDADWRAKLADGSAPSLPSWSSNFLLLGGAPSQTLAFRKGDIYIVTDASNQLNVREQPTMSARVLGQYWHGEYVQIEDGPIQADGYTWWKFETSLGMSSISGWAVENQKWFERSYLPCGLC